MKEIKLAKNTRADIEFCLVIFPANDIRAAIKLNLLDSIISPLCCDTRTASASKLAASSEYLPLDNPPKYRNYPECSAVVFFNALAYYFSYFSYFPIIYYRATRHEMVAITNLRKIKFVPLQLGGKLHY